MIAARFLVEILVCFLKWLKLLDGWMDGWMDGWQSSLKDWPLIKILHASVLHTFQAYVQSDKLFSGKMHKNGAFSRENFN